MQKQIIVNSETFSPVEGHVFVQFIKGTNDKNKFYQGKLVNDLVYMTVIKSSDCRVEEDSFVIVLYNSLVYLGEDLAVSGPFFDVKISDIKAYCEKK